jgi:hypothetical protein
LVAVVLAGNSASAHGQNDANRRLAMRAERKVIDKIVDGLKFHS